MPLLLSILGLLGIPVGVYLASLCARGGVSGLGWAWMLLFFVFDVAALWAQSKPREARIAGGIGLALLLGLAGLRHSKTRPTTAGMVIRLPAETPGPWYDRLDTDGDLGMMLFVAMTDFGGIRSEDARRAKTYVRAAWRRLRADAEFTTIPSPAPSNILASTSGASVHTLVLNPQEGAPRAVVYLHGVGGSSKLPCWLLARRMPDALVVCPSVGLGGEWTDDRGRQAWEHAFNYASAHSEAVYVIGQGYGGRGVLHLMGSNLVGHVAGVVLISGFDENYYDSVRRAAFPVLIVRGDADARTPAFRVDGLANVERVQNLELSAGHFVLYEQEDGVLEAIDNFCGAH